MKLGNREQFMLWRLLEFPIHRYLLSFRKGGSGYERAERHIEISKVLWEVEHVKTALPEYHEEWMAIHDLIADRVTNHLPRTIGFDPEMDLEYDWDVLADKLFRKIIKLDLSRLISRRNVGPSSCRKFPKSK